MQLNTLSLVLLRLSIGYIWLTAGFNKLLDKNFIDAFPQTIKHFIDISPYSFFSNFLTDSVLPNYQIFAQLVIWGEILTGIAFLIGFPLSIAFIAGAFMNITYFLAANTSAPQFLNILMVFAQLAAYANGAGNVFNLANKFLKK